MFNYELRMFNYELLITNGLIGVWWAIEEWMKKDNIVQQKSFAFAVKAVKLYQSLVKKEKEYVLSKQLLRSATSIGANIEEAIGGQSRKDFFAKLTIAYKEARETHYWLRLLLETNYLSKEQGQILLTDCDELLRLIGAIQKSTRKQLWINNYELLITS